MFQKLYGHLEEINRNTQLYKRALLHTEEWAGKVSEQLDTIIIASYPKRNPAHRPCS